MFELYLTRARLAIIFVTGAAFYDLKVDYPIFVKSGIFHHATL